MSEHIRRKLTDDKRFVRLTGRSGKDYYFPTEQDEFELDVPPEELAGLCQDGDFEVVPAGELLAERDEDEEA